MNIPAFFYKNAYNHYRWPEKCISTSYRSIAVFYDTM